MSKQQEDLDLLARNVHEWPVCPKVITAGNFIFENGATFHNDHVIIYGWSPNTSWTFTKSDWLSRRAELQNKPSWDGAPEWAEWLGQDNEGDWFWESHKPDQKDGFWNSQVGAKSAHAGVGLPLGDWRYTLEQRPDMHKSEPEIDTSAERVQKSAESVQDTPLFRDHSLYRKTVTSRAWFEEGELPPVGAVCEIHHKCWNADTFERVTIAAITEEYLITKGKIMEQHYSLKDMTFRPIRTERDDLVSVFIDHYGNPKGAEGYIGIADAIIAAGFSRGGAQ